MYLSLCYGTQGSATSATMRIFGEIGYDYCARIFIEELASLEAAGVTDIEVRIHSVGGSVVDGFGMFNAMLNSKATITTVNEGLAASTAGWLLLAGKTVLMADYALLMLHNPMTYDASPKAQEVCAKMRDSIATILAARTSNTVEAIGVMMDEETWLTAEDSLAKGFITAIQKTEAIVALNPALQTTNAMYLVVNSALRPTPQAAPTPAEVTNTAPETEEVPAVEPTPEPTEPPEPVATEVTPEAEAPAPTEEAPVMDAETEALIATEAAIEAEAATEQAAVEAAPAAPVAEPITNATDLTGRVSELEALVKSYQDKEAAAQAETVRNVATTMVKNAITAGRIEATAEATWVNLAIANPELAKATLEALKPQARTAVNVLAQAQTAVGATNAAGQVTLRELEKKNPAELTRIQKDTPEVYNQLYFNQYGVYPK